MKPGRRGQGGGQLSLGCGLALLQLVELRLEARGVRAFGNGLDQTPELAVGLPSSRRWRPRSTLRLCRRAAVQ